MPGTDNSPTSLLPCRDSVDDVRRRSWPSGSLGPVHGNRAKTEPLEHDEDVRHDYCRRSASAVCPTAGIEHLVLGDLNCSMCARTVTHH